MPIWLEKSFEALNISQPWTGGFRSSTPRRLERPEGVFAGGQDIRTRIIRICDMSNKTTSNNQMAPLSC